MIVLVIVYLPATVPSSRHHDVHYNTAGLTASAFDLNFIDMAAGRCEQVLAR